MLFGDWSFRVSVLYASWRGGRRCNDVAMEDKIEVTLHVIGISPFSNCRQFTLILVIYSRDVTHTIYARLRDEAGTRGLFFEYCVKQADDIFLDSLHSNLDDGHVLLTTNTLSEYEQAKKQKASHRKGGTSVDEDEFTLVTRGGRYRKTLGGVIRVGSKKMLQEHDMITTIGSSPNRDRPQ